MWDLGNVHGCLFFGIPKFRCVQKTQNEKPTKINDFKV